MNEHAGFASALSVLIVGVFAVLLHDRQPASLPPARPTHSQAPSKSSPTESIKPPAPIAAKTAAQPSVVNLEARPSKIEPTIARPVPAPNPHPLVAPTLAKSSPEETSKRVEDVKVSKIRKTPPAPKSPFTVVEAGETLADVANRVYGTSDAAESLWRANRDQVAMIDSRLERGTLLRTP